MNEQKLKEIFATVLKIPPAQVNDELAYNSIPTWDSIAHMALIGALDSAFDTMIDTDDVIAMSSFAEAKRILAKYGVQF